MVITPEFKYVQLINQDTVDSVWPLIYYRDTMFKQQWGRR